MAYDSLLTAGGEGGGVGGVRMQEHKKHLVTSTMQQRRAHLKLWHLAPRSKAAGQWNVDSDLH